MAGQRNPNGKKARREANVPKPAVAVWNRPSPRGSAADRLIGQLVPELDPTAASSDEGTESSDG